MFLQWDNSISLQFNFIKNNKGNFMTNIYSNINSTISEDGLIYGLITSSKGSKNKYKLHSEGYIVLSRIMSVAFPFNYGFIPNTTASDGNALDVIVISSNLIEQTAVIQLRIIGMLTMYDNGVADHKIVCVPAVKVDLTYGSITSYLNLNPDLKTEIEEFFKNYKKDSTSTVKVEISGWFSADSAIKFTKTSKTK